MEIRDCTIVIPTRIESVQRLENLCATIEHILNCFEIGIQVLEASAFNNTFLQKLLPSTVKYTFIKDNDPVFYRTKYINKMAKSVNTSFIAVWDADVIISKEQMQSALESLRNQEADIVFPYDGTFLDTTKIIRQMYMENRDVKILNQLKDFMYNIYGHNLRGGAFIANTELYKRCGMENEVFYGWGPEDWERCERWSNLGMRIKTTKGPLFHLSHDRDMNGRHNSLEQKRYTTYEKDLSKYSSAEELVHKFNLHIS